MGFFPCAILRMKAEAVSKSGRPTIKKGTAKEKRPKRREDAENLISFVQLFWKTKAKRASHKIRRACKGKQKDTCKNTEPHHRLFSFVVWILDSSISHKCEYFNRSLHKSKTIRGDFAADGGGIVIGRGRRPRLPEDKHSNYILFDCGATRPACRSGGRPS